MPGTVSDAGAPPSVTLSFANNFWGRDDAGVSPMLDRMQNAKTTCDELKAFYNTRATLEDEYSRKLFALCRKPLGSVETGSLRASLDIVRGEVEAMGKQHALIAAQIKSELEEPLAAFAGGMKERRKIVQAGIERLLKTKQVQTAQVNKSRDKYEQDCLRIKGYLAQGHMVMGQEERKNKAKLEKTQINMATNSNEYEASIKVLEETTGRWNKEWKAACDKFQDLEEERLDFTKSSLWSFANIASTVCVSDDASCEKIRLSLESCEVEKEITSFIKTNGTGQEIPDPPRYINFCRGDVNDTASEASEDDNYAVAQFPRTVNPAFRSSSPNPSNYESQHDPQSELAQRMQGVPPTIVEKDPAPLPHANSGRPPPLKYKQHEPHVPPNYEPSQHGDLAQVPHNEYPTEGMTMFCRAGPPSVTGSGLSSNTRPSSRDSDSEYSHPSSFTTADPVSGKSSPTKGNLPMNGMDVPDIMSGNRSLEKKRSAFFTNSPFRRKSKKETDHPAHIPASHRKTWAPSGGTQISFNSMNPGSASQQSSPTKPFSNRQNPFNRGSAPEGEEPADPRASFQLNVGNNVFDVASPDSQTTPKASQRAPQKARNGLGEESNVDPIAQALADLKQGTSTGMVKQSSMRVTADRYHGIRTPAPDTLARASASAEESDRLAAQRGTPPPAYEGSRKGAAAAPALGVPPPAFTSKEMRSRTENWGAQSSYGSPSGRTSQGSRPGTRDGNKMRSRSPVAGNPRATSPQPLRARSPGPGMTGGEPNTNIRARSPGPGPSSVMNGGGGQLRSRSPGPGMIQQQRQQQPQQYQQPQQQPPQQQQQQQYQQPQPQQQQLQYQPPQQQQPQEPQQQQQSHVSHYRAASPSAYSGSQVGSRGRERPHSRQNSMGMEIQLSTQDVQRYGDHGGSGRSRQGTTGAGGRPSSAYGGDPYMSSGVGSDVGRRGRESMDLQQKRERSKSVAVLPPQQPKAIIHYARALYSYTAAIPEELGFSKGDILAVLRLQDDGWWEAEVSKGRMNVGRVGLVPSNYLQRC